MDCGQKQLRTMNSSKQIFQKTQRHRDGDKEEKEQKRTPRLLERHFEFFRCERHLGGLFFDAELFGILGSSQDYCSPITSLSSSAHDVDKPRNLPKSVTVKWSGGKHDVPHLF
jgi:hypothetical protein